MMIWVFVACFLVYMYFGQKDKRKLSFTVNVSEQTEEAEHMTFGVHLFEDESEEMWVEKLNKAFKIAEDRRGFNNKRMLDLMEQARSKEKIAPLKKP